jgi:hypothetical protein
VVTRDDILDGRGSSLTAEIREGRTGQEKKVLLPLPVLSPKRNLDWPFCRSYNAQ